MKVTLADCRASRIPEVLNMCSDDTRLAGYLNEAVMRLLPKGKWVGTTARMRVCLSQTSCVTWPRQIETIETFSICGIPGTVRSQWYEFSDYGPGQQNGNCEESYLNNTFCSGDNLIDRGTACAFDDVADTGNRLKLYADLPEDVGAQVLVQGWDENGNWVLTDGGNVNGEYVTLGLAAVTTNSKFLKGGLTAIQKPITKGPVRLYDWNPTTGVQRALGIYEPDETVPEYRRSYVPGLSGDYRCCGSTDETCEKKTVYIIGKLKFIPVRNDTDYVLIGNIPALKDMCQSIKKREDNLIQEAVLYEASAIKCLEDELSSYYGDATVDPIRSMNAGNFAMSGVTSLM